MIVYGASLSPYVRKTVAYMRERALDFTHEQTMPGNTEDWFRAMSPFGRIPALKDDDFALSDSSVILHYLEAKVSAHPLLSAEPEIRARTLWWEEFADTILAPCVAAIFYNRVAAQIQNRPYDLSLADKAQKQDLDPILTWLEGQMRPEGFLISEAISIADIAVASLAKNLDYAGAAVDVETYPKLAAYLTAILGRPCFAELLAADLAFLKAVGRG